MDAPLSGITVLDLTQQLPGPYATQLLLALGARVIKIEPPRGDPARELDPPMFRRVNAGKESVVLDLKHPASTESLERLVRAADVLVESFRPGVTERLGVDVDVCKELNPRLVYCSISAYGQSGPYAAVPAHDLNLLAWGEADAARLTSGRIGIPWVDLGTGSMAALAIVAACRAAESSGNGTRIDIAMQDIAMSWAATKPTRLGGEPTYGVFKTADGHEVVIAILEDHFWLRLCRALRLREFEEDSRLATYEGRRLHAERIRVLVSQSVASLSLAQVLQAVEAYDLPVTAVDPEVDERAQRQLSVRGFGEGAFRLPIGDHRFGPVPRRGEHTESVLEEIARRA